MSIYEQITIPTEQATEIFEATGFNYDIAETENDDGTSTLTFDSPADARKFQTMAQTPIEDHDTHTESRNH